MKKHYCIVDKAWISYEGVCNWCGEKEKQMKGNVYTATWYEVHDDEGDKIRRFSTKEEADNFAKQDKWTVEKVSITRELFTPEEAPF